MSPISNSVTPDSPCRFLYGSIVSSSVVFKQEIKRWSILLVLLIINIIIPVLFQYNNSLYFLAIRVYPFWTITYIHYRRRTVNWTIAELGANFWTSGTLRCQTANNQISFTSVTSLTFNALSPVAILDIRGERWYFYGLFFVSKTNRRDTRECHRRFVSLTRPRRSHQGARTPRKRHPRQMQAGA